MCVFTLTTLRDMIPNFLFYIRLVLYNFFCFQLFCSVNICSIVLYYGVLSQQENLLTEML